MRLHVFFLFFGLKVHKSRCKKYLRNTQAAIEGQRIRVGVHVLVKAEMPH